MAKLTDNLPVKYSGFLQHISQVYVSIQEIWIEGYSFLKVVNGKPNFPLGVEHTAQVAPGNGKVRLGLNSFEVTGLCGERYPGAVGGDKKEKQQS